MPTIVLPNGTVYTVTLQTDVANVSASSAPISATSIDGSKHVISISNTPVQVNASSGNQTSVAVSPNRGPKGDAGNGGLLYTQTTAATTWTIPHFLNRAAVSVTVYDSSGQRIDGGDVHQVDLNTVQVSFGAPFAGTAYVL